VSTNIVLTEPIDGATTLLTLNRPEKRNALTIELMEAVCETMTRIAAEPGQRVVIIRGAGVGFCSGLDLREASQQEIAEHSANCVARLFNTVTQSPLITIAAAHGAAYAGGAGLLASCDFAIAADDLKLAFPEVRRGLIPALVAALLRDRIREGDARELFLIAEPISAARAQAMGLIHRVVAPELILSEACSLSAMILKGAPEAVRRTKQLLRELRSTELSQSLAHALHAHKTARGSGEATEGFAAFLEHREPAWD